MCFNYNCHLSKDIVILYQTIETNSSMGYVCLKPRSYKKGWLYPLLQNMLNIVGMKEPAPHRKDVLYSILDTIHG